MPRYLPPDLEPEELELTVGKLKIRIKMRRLQVAVIVLGLLVWAYFVLCALVTG